MWAKQSTALTMIVGPILDSAGAEYASAVIGDLSISKNGGTLTALASAATLTYIANGMYTLVLTTGNTDTLGAIEISCNKSTYQMRQKERHVVPANIFDAVISGSDLIQVDVTQLLNSGTPATNLNTIFNTDYATVYDTTNKAFLSKLGNFAMGGSSLVLTTGAIGCTTITASGTVTLNALTVSNATTLTGAVTLAAGLAVTQSTVNGNAVTFTGNGSGKGLAVAGGTTGGGIYVNCGTDATAITAVGNGLGDGMHLQGGTTGRGMHLAGGTTSGAGLRVVADGTNDNAIELVSIGTGSGIYVDTITVTGAVTVGTNAIPWNAAWDAEVQSECADALTAFGAATTAGNETRFDSIDAKLGVIDDFLDTEIAAILADTNELQTDWANGGRLDLILDIIAADTTTDIPALIAAEAVKTAAILADTGTDGVVLSTATCAKIADVSRRRTQANVEASSDGDALSVGSLYGLIQQAQESNATAAAGYLTIYKTDGSTSLGTKVLSTNAAADPVDGIS